MGLGNLLLGSLFGTLGLLALALSAARQRRVDPLLLAFGSFSLLYGLRLFFGSALAAEQLGVSRLACEWVDSMVTYVITVPAWLFFWLLLDGDRRSVIAWWAGFVTCFAALGVASDLVQGRPQTLAGAPNNIIVLAGLVLVAIVLFKRRKLIHGERRYLVAGFTVFGLFVLNDNLVGIGALPWTWREESIGFTIFVGCLGAIAARRFFDKERRLATIESELDTAREIQRSLLQDLPADLDRLSVAIRFNPSSAVAGDFYDFQAPATGALGILVADVSGHGVPAALIASMVKVAATSHADWARRPAVFLDRMNQTLRSSMPTGFVTATYAFLDPIEGEAIVGNAGHPAPLLVRADGGEAREIGGSGPILGRFPAARFEEQRIPLLPGDRLVLFTDGLPEARGESDESFGDRRLAAFAAGHRDLALEDFCDALLAEVGRFIGQRPPLSLEDDLTLVAIDVAA